MEPIGKIAYEAFRQSLAKAKERGETEMLGGTGLPEWEDLSPEEREAWQAASGAVADLYT